METSDKMETSDVNLGEWDIVNSASLETEEDKIMIVDLPEETKDSGKGEDEDEEEEEDNSVESIVENSSKVTPEEKENESNEKKIENSSGEKEKESGEEKESDEGEEKDESEEGEKEDESEEGENVQGSGVEDIVNEPVAEEIAKESGGDDIDPENHPHNDNCSTGSDIDIIEEISLEDTHHMSHPPLNPSLDMSLSSSTLEENLNPQPISPPELEPALPAPPSAVRRQPAINNHFLEWIFFGVVSTFVMYFVILQKPDFMDNFKEMEFRILELQQENMELKSQMSKADDGKSFLTLEEQIKALKDENSKLSVFMQDLIKQIEQQTIIFKKESETKGDKSHQHEINKLKEQVNELRTDNDELQKQLVRMRYSVYSPRSDSKPGDKKEKKEESKTENLEQENTTEILADEIKALRQKLYSEVEKLKEWKESVHLLMKDLENPPKESPKTKPKNPTARKEGMYEDIFRDMNDQFAEAVKKIPDFNLSDFVNRYIGVDKKRVKGVFDSVGHFFKKTQEKTKDIFDKNMKDDMWNFIGGFRKQWHVLKKSYFEYYKKMQQDYHASRKPKPHFEERHVPKSDDKTTSDVPPSGDRKSSFVNEPKEEFRSQRETRGERADKQGDATINRNSWVFERAQHRSDIREKGLESENIRKNRRESNFFSLDEDDGEHDSYKQRDMFNMN